MPAPGVSPPEALVAVSAAGGAVPVPCPAPWHVPPRRRGQEGDTAQRKGDTRPGASRLPGDDQTLLPPPLGRWDGPSIPTPLLGDAGRFPLVPGGADVHGSAGCSEAAAGPESSLWVSEGRWGD